MSTSIWKRKRYFIHDDGSDSGSDAQPLILRSKASAAVRGSTMKQATSSATKQAPDFTKPLRMIKLEIGDASVAFSVQADLLTYYSQTFDKMLNGPFKEAAQDCIKLGETNSPDTFGLFVQTLYELHFLDQGGGPVTPRPLKPTTLFEEVELWCLADYLQAPKVQNAVMTKLAHRRVFNEQEILKIGEHAFVDTAHGSMLRQWIADVACATLSTKRISDQAESIGPEFLAAMVASCVDRQKERKFYRATRYFISTK